MSGGSYEYIYTKLYDVCYQQMFDAEMDDLIKDLCGVLHDLEWWQSGDYSENEYRQTLENFKSKWFKGDRNKRLRNYIDIQIGIVKRSLYELIGEVSE